MSLSKPRFFCRTKALSPVGGEALSVGQVKRAEPGSPSNGEMKFGITRSSNLEVLPSVHVDNDLAAQSTQ